MAKAEWGTKRRCLSCAAKFYDLNRTPIECPKCGAAFQIETLRPSREAARLAAAAAAAKPKPVEKVVEEAAVVDGEVEVEDEAADEAVIEETDDIDEGVEGVIEKPSNDDDRQER